MDEKVSVTREDLGQFVEEIKVDLNTLVDEKLDKQFKSFEEKIRPQVKVDPNEEFGKTLAALRFGSRSKYADVLKALAPQTEGTAGDGGYLVPDVTRPEILRLMEEFGQGRQDFRVLPMGNAKVIKFPRKATGASVSRVGENTAIPDSKVTLDTVTLTASKAAAIVTMSSELDEDAIVDMGGYINSLLAEAFAEEEDTQYYNGSGSPFTGLFTGTLSFGKKVSVANVAAIDYAALLSLVYGMKSNYLRGASWRMHRTIYSQLAGLVGSDGHPLLVNAGDPTKASLFGFPIKLVEAAPDASTVTSGKPLIVLGNGNNAIIGQRKDLKIGRASCRERVFR